jgi:hypothetical protein
VPGNGGATGKGGIFGSGGGAAVGGSLGSGGIGGAGGALCSNGTSNLTPCGGDVVGIWTVTPSCLKVTGELDLSILSLGCLSAPVTGSLQVSGTWTGNANGTYVDNTTTTGSEQLTLAASCLVVSSVPVTCGAMATLLPILGYSSVSCASAAGGGCNCTAIVKQTGGLGWLSWNAQVGGTYKTSGNVVTVDDSAQYSYCVSGNRMTWSPQSTSPTITGTIAFQKGNSPGTGGAGGTGGTGGKMGTGGNPSGGSKGSGGVAGAGGSTGTILGPCDIYAVDGGPCVAAHSTVRALLGAYSGPLYQVKKADGSTKDIGVLAPGGFANAADQDVFCGTDPCTISIIIQSHEEGGRHHPGYRWRQ